MSAPGSRPRLDREPSWAWLALLAIGAPVAVVAALALAGDVMVAFVVYHVVICLGVPAAATAAGNLSPRKYADLLGLRNPSGEGWAAGLVTGLCMFALQLGGFLAIGGRLLEPATLAAKLTVWGIPLDTEIALFAYMLVFNSVAEELFWRGYLHEHALHLAAPRIGLPLVTVAFASYHVYTIASLVGNLGLALVGGVGVLVAAAVWAYLRQRYDSVAPAAVSHVLATAGYMTILVLTV